jgi:hypothetical protein
LIPDGTPEKPPGQACDTINVVDQPYQERRTGWRLQRSFSTSPKSRLLTMTDREHCAMLEYTKRRSEMGHAVKILVSILRDGLTQEVSIRRNQILRSLVPCF